MIGPKFSYVIELRDNSLRRERALFHYAFGVRLNLCRPFAVQKQIIYFTDQ